MTTCILWLDILQPGPDAQDMIRAVAHEFGQEWNGRYAEDNRVLFHLPMAHPLARQRATRALIDAGDDGQLIVRVA